MFGPSRRANPLPLKLHYSNHVTGVAGDVEFYYNTGDQINYFQKILHDIVHLGRVHNFPDERNSFFFGYGFPLPDCMVVSKIRDLCEKLNNREDGANRPIFKIRDYYLRVDYSPNQPSNSAYETYFELSA